MAEPNPNARPPTEPPRDEPQRRTAAPLLWIILLLALLAFGWFIYSQRAGVDTAPQPAPPPAVEVGDGREAAAERERAADDARRASREREARQERAARERAGAKVAGPDRAAAPLTRVEPDYPVQAYRAREEGTVLVGASIDATGKPVNVQVVRRSGSRDLDQAALEAVRQWTFEPAVRGGTAVASEVQVPVTFRIDR
jgi:protein TonB